MKNTPTKSFVMLLLFIVLLTYTAVILTKAVYYRESLSLPTSQLKQGESSIKNSSPQVSLDNEAWQKYTNAKYGLSFSYPGSWQPKIYSLDKDYDVIELTGSASPNPIKIYVSSQDYFGMAGLPTKKTTVGGKPALNVKDVLVGVKNGKLYYTFDASGSSAKLLPVFKKMLASVSFKQLSLK